MITTWDSTGGLVWGPGPHLCYKEPRSLWVRTTRYKDLNCLRSLHCVRQVLWVQQSFSAGGQKHFPDLSCSSSTRLEKELLCWQAGEHKAPKQMLSLMSGTSPYRLGVCEVLKHQIQSILVNEANSSWWKSPPAPTEEESVHGSTAAPEAGAQAPTRESSLKLATIFPSCHLLHCELWVPIKAAHSGRCLWYHPCELHLAINTSVLTQWPGAGFWPHTSFPLLFCFGVPSPVNF